MTMSCYETVCSVSVGDSETDMNTVQSQAVPLGDVLSRSYLQQTSCYEPSQLYTGDAS
jgi:hypothetical protein